MTPQTPKVISHQGDEIDSFFEHYMMEKDRKILFIGTLGFNDAGNHFASALKSCVDISYRFFVEKRPVVPPEVAQAGANNRTYLEGELKLHNLQFEEVEVVTQRHAATVAGRNAVKLLGSWLTNEYTDIVVDATSMSRGVCFPVIKQAVEFAHQNGIAPHILVAERSIPGVEVHSMSSDIACYMHGFQGALETDPYREAHVLWIPQLSEKADASLKRIFSSLNPSPAEICPVLPFPSISPRRADELLIKFREEIYGWDVNLLDMIYAHESDPMDVYATISRLHLSRDNILRVATPTPSTTVLSPNSWRVGSIGMLLASLDFDLPIMYTENIGYTVLSGSFPPINVETPECRWHLWLQPRNTH